MYGLAAEFDDAESLLDAVDAAQAAGYTNIKAFTPYYVEGLAEKLKQTSNLLPWLVFFGLLFGAAFGFLLQWYASTVGYAINVGGRPLNSVPAFIPIMFETGVLGAALFVVGGYFAQIGLPLPYHPIFNTPQIDLASRSSFFICIETKDRRFHLQRTRTFLEGLDPLDVSEVKC
jgi:hypothetical protein